MEFFYLSILNWVLFLIFAIAIGFYIHNRENAMDKMYSKRLADLEKDALRKSEVISISEIDCENHVEFMDVKYETAFKKSKKKKKPDLYLVDKD